LVNELKVLFDRMGLDVWEVIGAAPSRRLDRSIQDQDWDIAFRSIRLLTWKARQYDLTARFIEPLARSTTPCRHLSSRS
jgi:UDP-N-acetyl-D-glucosamine dehydrogenase